MICIVDYGISRSFVRENKHIPQEQTHSIIGSLLFCSLNSHKLRSLSRRDDIISAIYSFYFMACNKLPWNTIPTSDRSNINDVLYNMKYDFCSEIKTLSRTELNKFINTLDRLYSRTLLTEYESKPFYTL